MYYTSLATILVVGIIPLVLLAHLNYQIYKHMKSSSNLVEQNSNRQDRNNQENGLARVLIGIVIMFVCCHALRILLSFNEAIWFKNAMLCLENDKNGFSFWSIITLQFSQLLLVINSSSNMIIYCCLNSNFKNQLLMCIMKRQETRNCNVALRDEKILAT